MDRSLSQRSTPFDARLEELVESFLERVRAGERPTIAEYANSHPDLAAKLREVLPALLLVEDMKAQSSSEPVRRGTTGDSPGGSASDAGRAPRRLGEFRIRREIGRGGMGIVYEAEQEPLGRRVALKVLPYHSLLDERLLERFRREAQAAARLQHAHIVPVHGFGKEEGVHYYAMQFVEGRGLDRVLREVRRLRGRVNGGVDTGASPAPADELTSSVAVGLLTGWSSTSLPRSPAGLSTPVDPKPLKDTRVPGTPAQYHASIALLAREAAEALHYAHESGILHRDVKPSNLLLDARGSVWVTDFGLAKDEALGDLTASGEIVGTLRYMAPERLQGASDRRSDVYSLGLTFYELLTLKPAFAGSDRGRLLKQVMAEEPPRPRSLDGSIPRELELVVLKAIRKEPAERYATAGELATDLERFQNGERVSATAPTAAYFVRRFVRRHRIVTAALALAALGLSGFAAWRWVDAQRARRPNTIVVTDFDGDGDLDLAVSNHDSANVSVVLDPGREGESATTYAARANPQYITAGDWNQDGSPDLAVVNSGAGAKSVTIFLNGGRGRFRSGSNIDMGDRVYDLTAIDLEGDGRQDLAVEGTWNRVILLRNAGGGAFTIGDRLEVAERVSRVIAADVTGDGRMDLVTCSAGSRTISVLGNEGNGAFAPAANSPAGGLAIGIAAADLDGDADLDLATANVGSNDSSVILNDGHGRLGDPVTFPAGGAVFGVWAADLDGDADNDLVLSGSVDTEHPHMAVLRNDGRARFSQPEPAPCAGGPICVAPVDWNGDGRLDLVFTANNLDRVTVLLNQGNAVFREGLHVPVSPW